MNVRFPLLAYSKNNEGFESIGCKPKIKFTFNIQSIAYNNTIGVIYGKYLLL